MNIVERKSKETIRVIHNNLDAMEYGLSFLMQQGWSDNTRYSMMGIQLFEQELIGSGSISEIEQKYPEVEIQYPEKRDLLRSYPYIYVTEHEREVNK
ncbi:Uncharacterised protein [Lysinibacillus capsici]|uniref:Uncharacterized protein n=1 Tax=Lysinibacillus capsici TaxID=2115968 RepID=A0A2X0XH34_9BACI|nr:hypothetical protein [Lysinibacillus capsici]SPT98374.1 Uncharacterised protein [Lysinibacillus capsici]